MSDALDNAKFDWKTVKDSLSVRFVIELAYKGHTFICAETILLNETAWQSINDGVRTMHYKMKGHLNSIIGKALEDGTI